MIAARGRFVFIFHEMVCKVGGRAGAGVEELVEEELVVEELAGGSIWQRVP